MNHDAQGHNIYHLRNVQMDDKLQAQLSSIIYAYRPHDEIPTKEQLGEPIKRTSVLSHLWDNPTCNPFL